MSSFIITEIGLKKNARNLMEEFYENIHDEDFLIHDEVQKQRKYYDDKVVDEYQRILDRSNMKLYKNEEGLIVEASKGFIMSPSIEKYFELTKDEIKKEIEEKIKSKTINPEFVFDFLKYMDEKLKLDSSLEFEIDEDHFCLKKAFLKAYDLFHYSGYNLD